MAHNNVYARAIEYFNPPPTLVPTNGLNSLRFFVPDMRAALIMLAVACVFALSISQIAHMPFMSGIAIGILACITMRIFGGAYLLMAGAAAALAPILAEGIDLLGGGNLALGQTLISAVILGAGILMMIIALLGWGKFINIVSHPVVAGFIAAIGVTIIVKQIPNFFGLSFHSSGVWGILWETVTFEHVASINWMTMGTGLTILAIMIVHVELRDFISGKKGPILHLLHWVLPKTQSNAFAAYYEELQATLVESRSSPLLQMIRALPPQFFATIGALFLGYSVHMDQRYFIHLPDHPFEGKIDFGWTAISYIWEHPELWKQYAKSTFKLTFVDTIEICATVAIIERMDQYRRVSSPNRVLAAMAAANIIGSTVTPVHTQSAIPGGVKSSTLVFIGAKTLNASLYCALLLWGSVAWPPARDVINHMLVVSLSAIIAYTGWLLCGPSVWKEFWNKGRHPFYVFATSFGMSVLTDEILIGFFAAIAVEFILSYYRAYKSAKRHVHTGIETEPRAVFRAIFRNPVISAGLHGETFIVKADGPMTTFNRRFIPPCPQGAREVILDVSNPGVTYVDHTIHDLFLQLRMSCCGKSNFKLYGFVPLDSKGHASGWVRFERRNGESRDDVAFERRQGDRVA